MTQYDVELLVSLTITVADGSDAITRVTGPTGDEWRADLYPIHTEEGVLYMWADNAIRNGVSDASRLDGWGDLPGGEVTTRITSTEWM